MNNLIIKSIDELFYWKAMGVGKKILGTNYKTILVVFGTRPEAIKMAPLIKELKKSIFKVCVCVTAQHREMLDQVLQIFDIEPDYDLDIMRKDQSLELLTARLTKELSFVYKKVEPDLVLVHGDTTTTFVASLVAFYQKIKIGHVEAGLRTNDKYSPFPEEMNRKLTSSLVDFHFCPTDNNKFNLINEYVNSKHIYVTGNTVIDSMKNLVSKDYKFKDSTLKKLNFNKKIILVTAHRRESFGKPLENICDALLEIVSECDVEIIFPVHMNPNIRDIVISKLKNKNKIHLINPLDVKDMYNLIRNKIHLINPLDVEDMYNLIAKCYLVLTDSGGLQEECPSLDKPVLVLRNETERMEGVLAGCLKLVGTDTNKIVSSTKELIDDIVVYDKMKNSNNPYGDGISSKKIVNILQEVI